MQQDNYSKRHHAIPPDPNTGSHKRGGNNRLGDHIPPGNVLSRHSAPHSYVVEIQTGEVHHNRQHLTDVSEPYDSLPLNSQETDDDPNKLELGIHSHSSIPKPDRRQQFLCSNQIYFDYCYTLLLILIN